MTLREPEVVSTNTQTGPGVIILMGSCLAAGMVLLLVPLGPLAGHMSAHIVLMSALAPAIALACMDRPRFSRLHHAARPSLFFASAAQIAVLWIAHAPPAIAASMSHSAVHFLAQAALFAVALWFWLAIVAQRGAARWRAIFALLVTGKLFCLLAALLVFAPRALYPLHSGHAAHAAADPLADQYLAGLLMLVVCPLTYVFAGVLIAERWLRELRDRDEEAGPSRPLAAS